MVHNSNIYYSARMACSVPEFIELQRNSFSKLLANGISEEFAKITPLCLENNSLKIIFYAEKYQLLLPENSARDCIFNLKSYASKLYILAKLISKKSKQEVLEWVLVGNLPIMTRRGHFIINGSPRVVVHQVVRSPGVYFQQRRGMSGSSKQPRFYADFISRRGAWLRIQTDKHREFLARFKNGKKIEAALLRECFQFMESQQRGENTNNEYIWRSRIFNRAFEELFSDSSLVSKYANEKAYNYLYKRFKNPKSYDLGKIGRQHINKRLKLSITSDQLTSVDIDATLKHLVNLETGGKILDDIDHFKNRRVRTSGELLQNQFEIGVYRLEKLIITKLNIKLKELEIVLRDTLREKSKQSFLVNNQRSDTKIDLQFDPKTVNQRQEPLTSNRNSNSEEGLQIDNLSRNDQSVIFHNEKERPKSIKSKPNQFYNTPRKDVSVTNVESIGGIEDSIEQKTKNTGSTYDTTKVVQTVTERILPQKKIFESDRNWDKRVLNLSLKSKISATLKNVINSKPLNSAFREFFGTNPLSHYMDQTNPLAEMTHKRRLCSLGLGGVSQDTAGMAVRGIHPSHYGRVCPIETPEGKNAGLMNSLSIYTTINSMGFLETPCYQVFQGQVQRERGLFFISAQRESEERFNLAPGDLQLSRTHLLEKMSVPVRAADSFIDEFRKVCSDEVDYMAISPIQMISIATSLIPFLEHDDANRALMGSNMQRQAVPLMIAEKPLIGTGLESLVVAESGHVLQTESSGFISYVSSEKIVVENFLDYYPLSFGDNLLFPFKQKLYKPLISYLPLIEVSDNECFRSFSKNTSFSDNSIPRPFQWLNGVQESQQSLDILDSTTFGFKRGRIGSRIASIKDKSSFFFFTRQRNPISKVERKDVSSLDLGLRNINHSLQNYERSNQDTCLTQKALVREGEWVQQGDILADCSASSFGELALGKNILVAYLPWEGYNFEDAIVLNQRLIDEDVYTSIHIERYELDTRENEYGKEQITYFIPGTPLKQKRHLTRMGIAKIGSWLSAGDILVGKRTPLEPQPLTPYQKLLYDIMNKVAPREKDTSLRLPKGVQGRIIKYKISEETSFPHLSRNDGDQRSITEEYSEKGLTFSMSIKGKKETYIQSKVVENNATFSKPQICTAFGCIRNRRLNRRFKTTPTNLTLSQKPSKRRDNFSEPTKSLEEKRRLYKAHSNLWLANGSHFTDSVETAAITRQIRATSSKPKLMPYQSSISALSVLSVKREENKRNKDLENTSPKVVLKQNTHAVSFGSVTTTYGEQRWVEPNYTLGRNYTKKTIGEFGLKNIHVYVAEKRKIQIGDKMSGRHGNKGIVSLIMPRQDMPYLPDGTPIDIILNPLGVPSRMNVGQVFECLLGLSASKLGQQLKITPFDEIYGAEASKSLVYLKLYQARLKSGQDWLFQLDFPGKTILFDGRSGECFDQWVTVGRAYMLKLIHLVAEKIHARATGPYALITQQPLGGRSKNGGQRLGEMEVWALEGFGAAYTLQELLTKKSDDEQGRKQIIETILKIEPSSPFTTEKFSERKERLKKLGSPEIFQVLVKELQSLCLGIGIYSLISHPLKKEQIDVV